MDIGKRLKVARESIGYTLAKTSQESGIGVSSLSEFENGEREPRISCLSKLAEVYKKNLEFFLTDEPITEDLMLWRDEPNTNEERKKIEAEFRQLCEQYRRLEILTDEVKEPRLPTPEVQEAESFNYKQAEKFAKKVYQTWFCPGDIPITSLKNILEERYYVKIFYLDFSGSSISLLSNQFGPAVLLNEKSTQWRRSFDLAHELFHLLTWKIFRTQNPEDFIANQSEEKLADTFASRLLMPEESIKERVESNLNEKGQISFDQLDNIAREFDVSLMAVIYRIAGIYKLKKEVTEKYITAAEEYRNFLKPRSSYKPNKLPERYCDLAQRALREGKLSLIQFAKYMDIGYKKAQEYLTEDEELTDEKISISVT
jgi:Zn-dependent peptidase ImmA (M78 family)